MSQGSWPSHLRVLRMERTVRLAVSSAVMNEDEDRPLLVRDGEYRRTVQYFGTRRFDQI
jgi:hypothetical protein